MKNKLTAHHFLYPLLVLAAVALGVFWARAEIANARAEERSIASADKQKDLQAQRDANDAAARKAFADLENDRAQPATVQTVTKFLPAPLAVGSEVKIERLADSPMPQLVVTGDAQKNLQAIQDMEIKHAECDTNLSACQKDKELAAQQFNEMKTDRDNWKNAAKGGSKWHRFTKGLKVIGCAGGGAALGSLLGKTKGAAVGAVAGAGGCQIFW